MAASEAIGQDGPMSMSLESARALGAARGVELTELRAQVLALVLASGQPIGAYPLLDRLKALRPGAAPPTVYRALDFLLGAGLIHRVERLNAFIGCDTAGEAHEHPHLFLICRVCGAAREVEDHAVAHALEAVTRREGFAPERVTIEIEGLCAACRPA
jgi:Fur family transcriptional regulator, zinc uptake regulator